MIFNYDYFKGPQGRLFQYVSQERQLCLLLGVSNKRLLNLTYREHLL